MPRVGIAITRDAIQTYFTNTIIQDLDSYLIKINDEWGEQCGFTLNYLRKNYNYKWIEVQVDRLKTKKIKKEKEKEQMKYYKQICKDKKEPKIRCCARTWSYPPFVFYDEENDSWILGDQCSRKQKRNGLCGLHLRNLPHGKMSEEPPHDRFEKHKRRALTKN